MFQPELEDLLYL